MPKLERSATSETIASLVPTDERRLYIESKNNESKREERTNEQLSITSITEINNIHKNNYVL